MKRDTVKIWWVLNKQQVVTWLRKEIGTALLSKLSFAFVIPNLVH